MALFLALVMDRQSALLPNMHGALLRSQPAWSRSLGHLLARSLVLMAVQWLAHSLVIGSTLRMDQRLELLLVVLMDLWLVLRLAPTIGWQPMLHSAFELVQLSVLAMVL